MKKYVDTVGISRLTPLSHMLELGKRCKKCNNCCKKGSGFLIEEDVKNIAGFLGISEKGLKEKYLEESERFSTKRFRPKTIKKGKLYGACVFLDEKKGCAIHQVKPLECKVSTCDENGEAASIWFMLNFFVNPDDPKSVREYASYLKTQPTIPGGEIEKIVPDKEKLRKILNYEIMW